MIRCNVSSRTDHQLERGHLGIQSCTSGSWGHTCLPIRWRDYIILDEKLKGNTHAHTQRYKHTTTLVHNTPRNRRNTVWLLMVLRINLTENYTACDRNNLKNTKKTTKILVGK